MKFEKPIMSITELMEYGFSRTELNEYAHVKNQKYAFTSAGRGKWRFDTEEFSKYLTRKSERDSASYR